MNIDMTKLRSLLTASNIGKIIAVIIALMGLPGLAETAPKAVSSSGVPVNDLITTLTPFVGALATWFGASWMKASPELVLAAIGFMRNPKDADAAARFETACLRMLGTRHEGNADVQAAIAALAKTLAAARFPEPPTTASSKPFTEMRNDLHG